MSAAAAAAPDICSVLLVEDDDDTRDVTARLLRAAGCLVRATASVGEALLLLEDEWLPSHILLDLMLPDAGGIVILRSVRRRNLPVKIAVVTAAGPESPAVADAQRWKPDAIFYKPIVFAEVETWLEQT